MIACKVTVGLVVKNAASTVKEAIESIVVQDFPHESTELIVVDGFSVDKTISIIKSYLYKLKMTAKFFRENQGLGSARQAVVENAQGDYIVWVDGDMILPSDYVRKQVEFMERNPIVGIAKGKYGVLENQEPIATLENIELVLSFQHTGETNAKSLGASGCIYRTKAIRQVGGFDKRIKGAGEDNDIEDRIRAKGWALYVSEARFYEHRRDSWRSLWKEYFWHGYAWRYLFDKNPRMLNLHKMVPPIAIAIEMFRIPDAYRLTRRKISFLLPLHYLFKRIAWLLGFLKGRLDSRAAWN
ncbi:MAG: glycosyltransferase [Candidatus Bathyarchaeia archaeon]